MSDDRRPDGGDVSAVPVGSPALTGFSARAKDPFFNNYLKKRNRTMRIFGVIMAAVEFIVLLILGALGVGGLTLSIGAIVGVILALFTLIWALAYGRKGKKETDYDGTVVNKTVEEKVKEVKDNDGETTWKRKVKYTEYKVHIRCDDGRMRYMTDEFESPRFNDFQIGERLRYHGHFYYYEHYDKSRMTHLNCLCCGTINDIRRDGCEHCGAPLLK